MGWRVDHDLDEEVAPPATVEMGDAPAPQPEYPSGLCARGHDEVLGAVEGLVAEVGTQGGLGDGKVEHVDEVAAMALEAFVGDDAQMDVEVAVAAAAGPGRAPAGQAQCRPVVHAAGHIDGVGPLLGDAPFAPAVAARAGDLLTGAAAVAARGRRHHLAT